MLAAAMYHNKNPIDSISELVSPIGLIAGSGSFPREFAENAISRGLKVRIVGIRGEVDPALEKLADRFEVVSVGQVGKLVRYLKNYGISQVAFAGGVTRVNFVDGFRMDWTAIRMLSKLRSFNDDSILRGIIGLVEESGMQVFAPSLLLANSVPKKGVLTTKTLSEEEIFEAKIGWDAARAIGHLDIGQSVIVRNKTVIAVEAVEGTDATIARTKAVSGIGGVLVKLAKEIQDLRIDLPTVGVKTIEGMKDSRLSALVLEAGRSIILQPDEVVRLANSAGISITVCAESDELRSI